MGVAFNLFLFARVILLCGVAQQLIVDVNLDRARIDFGEVIKRNYQIVIIFYRRSTFSIVKNLHRKKYGDLKSDFEILGSPRDKKKLYVI